MHKRTHENIIVLLSASINNDYAPTAIILKSNKLHPTEHPKRKLKSNIQTCLGKMLSFLLLQLANKCTLTTSACNDITERIYYRSNANFMPLIIAHCFIVIANKFSLPLPFALVHLQLSATLLLFVLQQDCQSLQIHNLQEKTKK